jgi:hypothetical protein
MIQNDFKQTQKTDIQSTIDNSVEPEPIVLKHKFLGEVHYTEFCAYATKGHAMPDEIYVEYEGDVRVVTRCLVVNPDGSPINFDNDGTFF